MTPVQRSTYCATVAVNSPGVPAFATFPMAFGGPFIASSFTAFAIFRLRRPTIAGGVSAGAAMLRNVPTEKPGLISPNDGVSGSSLLLGRGHCQRLHPASLRRRRYGQH